MIIRNAGVPRISITNVRWNEARIRINSFICDTVKMFRGEMDYSYGSMAFDNYFTYKKNRSISMPISGQGIMNKSFGWGRGRVELKRSKDDLGMYLSFADHKGKVRKFQWIDDGFSEIRPKKIISSPSEAQP